MKSYPIVCPSCSGSGVINNPMQLDSSPTIICPACNGTKVVIVNVTYTGVEK